MKRGPSFRLRLAAASALLAGVALAGFAAAALWQMHSLKLDALDRNLREQTERELLRPWPPSHWPRHEQILNHHLGAPVLLWVEADAADAYRSAAWPATLDPRQLPWPTAADRLSVMPPDWQRRPPPPEERFAEPLPPPPLPPLPLRFRAASVLNATTLWRVGLASTPRGRMAIAVSLDNLQADMAHLRNAFALAMLPTLAVIGLGAWYVSGRALSPLHRLSATMASLTAQGLDQRIALGREDPEFRQLIEVFNGMLARLQRSFLHASRFSADAAHELKTPLAILQGQIERAIAQCEDGSPLQAKLTDILDEVQRLGTISRKLLLLSLADAGRLRLHRVRLDLSALLTDLLDDAQMLAPTLTVSGDIAPGLVLQADAELLRQVLHNLLSNAIKYNVAHGWIRLSARADAHRALISFRNASTGIPAAERERIFERFYRADPAHSRQIEGIGLGLSLAREIARAHGGDLRLLDATDADVCLMLLLPL